MNIIDMENQYTSGVYAKRGISIVHGKAALLYDDQNREYIDCVGGQGVVNLGHCHPAIISAITLQAQTLISCPEMFSNDKRARLQQKLVSLAPENINRAFLCNSGTEAIEAAIKFARYSTGKRNIVCAMRGFHGRTLGALSATWNKKYREPFEPLISGFTHIPFNNLEKLNATVDGETAAVILEVIQGEGGVYPAEAEFLQAAQNICHEKGALLIIDEIQTGFGRTGKLFAFEHFNLQPDMICLAKSIAGGLPMGAVLLGQRVHQLSPGIHGTTFGGNPLVCAAALAALDVLEKEDLAQQAAEKGAFFITALKNIQSPLIREVRGMGLMVGVEIKQKVAPYLQELMDEGVLALPAGLTVLRFLPPLVITIDQLQKVINVVEKVLSHDLEA